LILIIVGYLAHMWSDHIPDKNKLLNLPQMHPGSYLRVFNLASKYKFHRKFIILDPLSFPNHHMSITIHHPHIHVSFNLIDVSWINPLNFSLPLPYDLRIWPNAQSIEVLTLHRPSNFSCWNIIMWITPTNWKQSNVLGPLWLVKLLLSDCLEVVSLWWIWSLTSYGHSYNLIQ